VAAHNFEIPPPRYGVILTRRDIDRFEHNALFAHELTLAFRSHGMKVRTLEYCGQPREVFAALRDPACAFALCFNGFGSELTISARDEPSSLSSAYTAFGKPLLDFMHDCPAHDAMRHQVEADFSHRLMLLTDYGYAQLAKGMGFRNVSFVPSITFPATIGPDIRPIRERSIRILLPVGLASPDQVAERLLATGAYKNRLYKALFEAVTSACVCDWRRDPVTGTVTACRECGIDLDFRTADGRFLLTAVLDYTKFARRRKLLRAIAHLPVTVISDRSLDDFAPASHVRLAPQRSASELLRVMADSQCVICPTPHMTGFHERALGAFTAGAAVFSPLNDVLESNFVSGQEFLFFHGEAELAAILEDMVEWPGDLASIAAAGRARAMGMFHPKRVAALFLSLLLTRTG
jgi:hypothetical protein